MQTDANRRLRHPVLDDPSCQHEPSGSFSRHRGPKSAYAEELDSSGMCEDVFTLPPCENVLFVLTREGKQHPASRSPSFCQTATVKDILCSNALSSWSWSSEAGVYAGAI